MMIFLIFLVVFMGLVIIHEFGHYAAARLQKVEVEEFAVGLPPRAFRYWRAKGRLTVAGQDVVIPSNFDLPFDWRTGLKRQVVATAEPKGDRLELRTIELMASEDATPSPVISEASKILTEIDPTVAPKPKAVGTVLPAGSVTLTGVLEKLETGTEFTVNWLPFGGFMRPKGEMDPTAPGGLAAASAWTRLWVLLAGPAMNLLAGAVVVTILVMQSGVEIPGQVVLLDVSPSSPAAQAGFLAGDVIVTMNGEEITAATQFREFVYAHLDQPVEVVYVRNGETMTAVVMPSSQRAPEEGAVGVVPGYETRDVTFFEAVPYGIRLTWGYIHELLTLPARIIQGAVPAEQARFVGLKGIYDFMSEAVTTDTESRQAVQEAASPSEAPPPTNYTLSIVAMLSISLGVFNLLPFPALDGGRILFLLPELIFRRQVPAEIEARVHMIGMALLLIFMLVVNLMDFINPVAINLPK